MQNIVYICMTVILYPYVIKEEDTNGGNLNLHPP